MVDPLEAAKRAIEEVYINHSWPEPSIVAHAAIDAYHAAKGTYQELLQRAEEAEARHKTEQHLTDYLRERVALLEDAIEDLEAQARGEKK